MTLVHVQRSVPTAVRPSERVLRAAAMFGLGVDERKTLTIVPQRTVPLPSGGVVFITGPSGGGKTTVMNLIADGAMSQELRVIRLDALAELEDVPLVDVFDAPLDQVMSLLSVAGLGDAFVMLRRPSELSDGQRWRLKLARAMFEASGEGASGGGTCGVGRAVILADEFAATLDRLTAIVIARNVKRWIARTPHTFIAATTHDDLLEALQPDVLIHKGLGAEMEIIESCPHRASRDAMTRGDTSQHSHILKNMRVSKVRMPEAVPDVLIQMGLGAEMGIIESCPPPASLDAVACREASRHSHILKNMRVSASRAPNILIHKELGKEMEIIESCPHRASRDAMTRRDASQHSHILKNVRVLADQPAPEAMSDCVDASADFAAASAARNIPIPIAAPPPAMGPDRDNLIIERGSLADYERLAAFHYRSHRPGAATAVLRIVHHAPTVVGRFLRRKDESAVVGVLVRGLSHLGCSLRDLATGGRYRGLKRTEAARLLNKEFRTISRVVVDPRWRGLGLAVQLVRAALNEPETIFTEALAAMGQVNPFFERAGMTRYERPPLPSHARLMDALATLGIEPATLASIELTRSKLAARNEREQRWIERELRLWQRAAGGDRRSKDDMNMDDLLRAARERLLFVPVYYLARHQSALESSTVRGSSPGRAGG